MFAHEKQISHEHEHERRCMLNTIWFRKQCVSTATSTLMIRTRIFPNHSCNFALNSAVRLRAGYGNEEFEMFALISL